MKYGLLGHKIDYSLSPIIHKMINPSGIEYKILDLPAEALKEKLPEMVADFQGFNVTIPHKQQIMDMCDEVDPLAAGIGAVNTIHIKKGKWVGYNTDYLGFLETVKQNIQEYLSYHPVIVGYGGVARAVIFALRVLGYRACSVVSGIDQCEREDFIQEMNKSLKMEVMDTFPDAPKLWINCTPIGGAKIPDIPEDFIPFEKSDFLYDLNYTPIPTYLEAKAAKQGLLTLNGLNMLVAQAIEAQKIWNKGCGDLVCDTHEIIRSLINRKSVS